MNLNHIEKIEIALKRTVEPLSSNAVRITTDSISEETNVKSGVSTVTIRFSSPRLGNWVVKFKIESGDTPSKPRVVGTWDRSGNAFQISAKGCKNKKLANVKRQESYEFRKY